MRGILLSGIALTDWLGGWDGVGGLGTQCWLLVVVLGRPIVSGFGVVEVKQKKLHLNRQNTYILQDRQKRIMIMYVVASIYPKYLKSKKIAEMGIFFSLRYIYFIFISISLSI